jgi:hypothetical protein
MSMPSNNQHPTLTGSKILWATPAGEGTTTLFTAFAKYTNPISSASQGAVIH